MVSSSSLQIQSMMEELYNYWNIFCVYAHIRRSSGKTTLYDVWGIDGIWVSIVAAEAMAVVVTVIFLVVKRKEYHY